MKQIKGVNIGGWLVLEKWMTPELYAGYDAEDEYNLLLKLGEKRSDVITKHRNEFMTEMDFKWIKDHGLDYVRLPIGHWLFEDQYPYFNAVDYVNKAFRWSEKDDLKVLLDVHAAPGCQNGFDNGGLSGICEWHKGDNIKKTLVFIDRLAAFYKDEPSLWGIEVLNEPRWDIDIKLLKQFYSDAYDIIRKHLDISKVIMFHDAFRLEKWKDFFTKKAMINVILDTHMYQTFSHQDSIRNPAQIIEKTSILRYNELIEIDYVDIVVGEWSLGVHHNVKKMLNSSFLKETFYRAVGGSLLTTFELSNSGWFFWNYKLSEESTIKHEGWSFRDAVTKGYLPETIK